MHRQMFRMHAYMDVPGGQIDMMAGYDRWMDGWMGMIDMDITNGQLKALDAWVGVLGACMDGYSGWIDGHDGQLWDRWM